MRREVVVCLNKSDLVNVDVLEAWKGYLENRLDVCVVCTSCKDGSVGREDLLECLLQLQPFLWKDGT